MVSVRQGAAGGSSALSQPESHPVISCFFCNLCVSLQLIAKQLVITGSLNSSVMGVLN